MSQQMSGFRGSLNAYYQEYDSSGNLGAVFPIGNLTNFALIPDAENVDVISTQNEDYGQAADSMVDSKPSKCSWEVNRFNVNTEAMAVMGSYAPRTAAEATVTDEVVTIVKGELFRVAGLDVSAETITDSSGVTTYVKDTDYEYVDAQLGLFRALSSGSMADGDIKVDYTKAAETGYKIEGGTKSDRFIRLFGRGINRMNSKRSIVDITKMSVRPSGNLNRVSTDPASMGFEGTIVTPSDGSAGYSIVVDA